MTRLRTLRNRRPFITGCAIAAAAVIPAAAQAAPADYIYWTVEQGTAIGRVANQSGATPDASFISGLSSTTGITLLGSRLYWRQAGGIGRAYTDGTDKQTNFVSVSTNSDAIFAGRPCSAVVSCDSYLYYGQDVAGFPATYQVVRRNIDGTAPTTIVSAGDLGQKKPTGLGYLSGTANAAGNIFVAYQDNTNFQQTAGVGYLQGGTWDNPRWTGLSMVVPAIAVGWGTSGPGGLSYVYIANDLKITRLTAGCSGGGAGCYDNNFVTGASPVQGVRGVAVDDTYIYWVNKKSGNDSIGRVGLDGTTGKNADFIPLPGEAYGIAVGSSSGGGGDNGGGSSNGGSSSGTGGGSSTSSGGSSGGSSASTPSNTFTAGKGSARGLGVTTRVTVPGAGRLVQRGTRARSANARQSNAVARVTACAGARSATAAGVVTVTCRLNAATQAARRRGPVTLRIATTFTPTGGTGRTTAQTVTLPRLVVRAALVTG